MLYAFLAVVVGILLCILYEVRGIRETQTNHRWFANLESLRLGEMIEHFAPDGPHARGLCGRTVEQCVEARYSPKTFSPR
jgi:hypothetical protein